MSKDFFYQLPGQRSVKRNNQAQKSKENQKNKPLLETENRRNSSPQASPRVSPPASPIQNLPAQRVTTQPVAQRTMETQTNPMTKKDLLNEIYTNPNFPSAYSGDLQKFLQQKESLSRHRQRRHIFKRRKVFVGGPYTAIQADTIFYRDYARQNNGFKYILGKGCYAEKTVTVSLSYKFE